jgi:hypothetical protein
MITLEQVREGSTVLVRGSFGNAPARRATVTGVEADIKNGQPGIDYELTDGESYWAYLDQVEKVLTY